MVEGMVTVPETALPDEGAPTVIGPEGEDQGPVTAATALPTTPAARK